MKTKEKIITTISIRHGGSLLELKQRIDDYVAKGFTEFNTTYELGYYDEVYDIIIKVSK